MKIEYAYEAIYGKLAKKTSGSAGVDIKAHTFSMYDGSKFEPNKTIPIPKEGVPLKKDEMIMIGTGVRIVNMSKNMVCFVRGRSGIGTSGIWTFDGTVDSDYEGEIFVALCNVAGYQFDIKQGDRIAQLVFCLLDPNNTSVLVDKTKRGEAGFGSTGM